jgi:hypothetical protein
MREFDGFKKSVADSEIEDSIERHITKNSINPIDVLKLFPVLARRQWLKRFLAHAEIFKMTLDVPGDVAELGVFRGLGLMTWANLLEIYAVGDRTKNVWGFDNWKGFVDLSKEDGPISNQANKIVGGFNPEAYFSELNSAIDIFDNDRFIPWKKRIKLVNGQIEDIVPQFIKENPGVKFSLIHFDCDLYSPTKVALEALWDRLSRGGILIFDEYSIHDWPGETRAVDEFFSRNKNNGRIKKFSWTNAPAGYLVKD